MKIKKRASAILIVIIVITSLVGCSKEREEEANTQPVVESQNTGDEQNSSQQSTSNDGFQSINKVLVDNDKIKISVIAKSKSRFMKCAQYELTLQNKLNEKVIIQMEDVSVDGVMANPLFSTNITAHKTAKDNLEFMEVENIGDLKNVEGTIILLNEKFDRLEKYKFKID